MTLSCAEIAARIHADMCDDDRNGYSWSPRQGGDYGGNKTLTIDGRKYTYPLGSWDCSSSVIKAWQLAIQYTKYKGKLDGATYTGNMRSVFEGSGLFYSSDEWAKRGDVYLNDANHTALCQDGGEDGVYGYDCLSEFCINEFGQVYGGQVGDQTGTEAYVHAFYEYSEGWNQTLHYNGKADASLASESQPATKETTSASQAASKGKKRLNGIDISSWQGGIDVSKVEGDFVIVKVSGGTSYVNDKAHGAEQDWRDIANKVLKSGKLLGLYHYACEYNRAYTGKSEAKFFLEQIKGFEGKALMCLDFEAYAQNMPVSYAKEWLDVVAEATGSTPVFYAYASYLNSRDHSLIKDYPLWMASYLYRYEGGSGYVDDPDNIWDTNAWDKMTMYQYASTRYIKGYSGNLDVNVFYGTAEDWERLAGSSPGAAASQPAAQEPASGTSAASKKKSVATVAKEVLKGKWGNGEERKSKLEAAGYDYAKVQKKVNDLVIESVAKDVIAGKYGNASARKKKLKAAGYDYDAVQAKVNELLGSKKSVDDIAKEVVQGKWGNGDDRRSRLEAAGYDYSAVQARVNEII